MPTKQEYIMGLADQRFKWSYRELLAHLPNVNESLVAYIQLNDEEELSSTELDFNAYLKILENALLRLIDNETLSPAVPYNSVALAELAKLRRATGIGIETLPPPPPTPPTAQELLEAEVIADYNGSLSAAKMREKRNTNRAYNECFVRLANSGRLESRITSNVIAGA